MVQEVLSGVNINTKIFREVIPCCLIDGYKRFGGIYCLHLQGTIRWGRGTLKMETVRHSKMLTNIY
jgi:hypothetical protein